jgi:hypothetical protein
VGQGTGEEREEVNHAHTPAPAGRCTRQTHSAMEGVPFHRQAFHMGTTREMIGVLVKDPDEGGEQGGVGRRASTQTSALPLSAAR